MNSQTPQFSQGRAHTMSSHVVHPQFQRPPPPPTRQMPNGHGPPSAPPNGYPPPPPSGQYQAYNPGASATMSSHQLPRHNPNTQQRFAAYPRPQRLESRPSPAPQYPDPRDFNRPMPPPALNSDSTRSRSMAKLSGPPYQTPPSNFNHTSATASRREQYHAGTQVTQLGRPVPEKHANERAMSMTSWSSDRDPHIMNSGRSIPYRRPPSSHDQQIPVRYDSMMQPGPDEFVASRQPSDASQRSRTMSMASTVAPDRTMSVQSQATQGTQGSSGKATLVSRDSQRKVPVVYPAMLSLVAEVFREKISLGERQKNGLSYQNAFSGTDSVDLIASIIRTNDRNLALLLGRALDAQKFFHDVTYDHRLRDAPGEVYQFKETMGEDKSTIEVNGVFTLLTECYSPTCNRDTLCYSIACPRRLEQQARLNLKPEPVLGNIGIQDCPAPR